MTTGTQAQKINAAVAAYILPLNKSDYTVYLAGPAGLDNLWPSDSNLGNESVELLPNQVYNATNYDLPAFLFRIRNTARRTAFHRIAHELRKVGNGLPVYYLDGGSPEPVLVDS